MNAIDTIPGTIIRKDREGLNLNNGDFLYNVFAITNGLMLSQVKDITGMDGPALHNWIRRGWVAKPVNKKYTINHVARILIINLLRSVMPLEKVACLLKYVNGDTEDLSDDIVDEVRLYKYICKLDELCNDLDLSSEDSVANALNACIEDYEEKISGSKEKLFNALKIVLLAYYAAKIKSKAVEMLEGLAM
jgi:DNA-binding transcriptional MerR regulator